MMEGRVLGGRYELLQIVGQGGMGTVYKARCRILDRIVAVKILKEEFADNASFVEKFRTEAMSAARITHPNIVNVYDVGQDHGVYYIVMEYVEGQTLKQYIASQGIVPLSTAINITVMICDGVQYAHENQVIHRDLKPQNILITNQGQVKVADFGIARANTTATITFNKEQVIGSVHYISPEQARGAGVTYATDIYSIGCILYEMCTGQLPFDAESPVTVALKHLHDEPIPPADINPEISPELEDIILHAMMKLPDRRFASADEMSKELLMVGKTLKGSAAPHVNTYVPAEEKLSAPSEEEVASEKIAAAQEVKQDVRQEPRPEPKPEPVVRREVRSREVVAEPVEEENPPRKRHMRTVAKILIVVALVAFVAGIASAFSKEFFGSEVRVPALKGESLSQAEQKLTEVGLKLNIISKQPDDEYDVDMVVSQDPEAGTNVKKGREIKVIVSTGLEDGVERVQLGNLQGMTLDEAKAYLEEIGLMAGKVDESYDQREKGKVISQTPTTGSTVAKGTEVDLIISLGPEPNTEQEKISTPNLLGSTRQEALEKLHAAGLTLGDTAYAESSDADKDKVIGQTFNAGAMLQPGTSVGITLGSGAPQPAEPEPAPEDENNGTETGENTGEENGGETAPVNDELKTKAVSIQLPGGNASYMVSVEINDAHGERTVYQQSLSGGMNVTLNLSYYGSGTYNIYLDSNVANSGTLD